MLKILILEDEKYTREFLHAVLEEIPDINIYSTGSSIEAVKYAKDYGPDLILLDIELDQDDYNGIEVAQKIYDFNQEVFFVFVTAYTKYAIDSFVVHPYSYIVKPVDVGELSNLVLEIADKVKLRYAQKHQMLSVKSNNEIILISKQDIYFIEILNKTLFIHAQNVYKAKISLREVQAKLGKDFIRVHRSYVVNINKIKNISEIGDRTYQIEFCDYPHKAQMSRYHYNKLKLYLDF
ncbi:MAG: LytTR family DNA-binding domain-containing protein [Syntrophomonadaceae bacterium]|nr:LytTR family DNA-binding domain-containing protein [Syntrophomonadaceae bacterium]MDD4550039.1 LytTR family DNA-binding domain-containing protein [Syntrophomonadaceae bacterium]